MAGKSFLDDAPDASFLDDAPDAGWLDDAPQAEDPETTATRLASEKYEEDKPGLIESAGLAAGRGITRGWNDELLALVGSRLGGADYEQAKAQINRRQRIAEKEHPTTFGAFELAGNLVASPVTRNPLAAVGIGAAEGITRSLGDAEKIDGREIAKAGVTGVIDGAVGGALTKYGPAVADAVLTPAKKTYDGFRNWAARQAVKAAHGNQPQTQRLQEKGLEEAVGRQALDDGVIGWFTSNRSQADRAAKMTQKYADETRPIYEQSKGSTISSDELLGVIGSRQAELVKEPGKAPIVKKLGKYADDITNAAEAGTTAYNPSDIRRYRGDIQDTLNFNSKKKAQLGADEMRKLLREQEMGLIDKVDPALKAQNEALFRKIRLGNELEDITEKGAAKSASNNAFGLTSQILFSGGIAAGSGGIGAAAGLDRDSALTLAAVLGGGRELTRRYGNQVAAKSLDALAGVIASPKYSGLFKAALDRGGTSAALLHQKLLGSDPDYRAAFDQAQEPQK